MKVKFGSLIFKPMPGLTIVTLICFAILISLGNWQYKRLYWKTNLLAEIHQAANAAPLTHLAQADAFLKAGEPLDFRRIELNGTFVTPSLNAGQAFHLMRSDGKRYYWRLYQTYRDGDEIAFVATYDFDEANKAVPPATKVGQEPVIGYVRMVQFANKFIPKSTPEKNRWFAFNSAPEAMNWAAAVDGENTQVSYFVDQVMEAKFAADLPVRIPELANNHLDYMLTWYSFVIILLVIYLILHKRAGRLYIKRGRT